MDVRAPDQYDLVLDWLEVNPGATLVEIFVAVHVTRYRAETCLKYGLERGTVRRWRPAPAGHIPYQWYRKEK